MTISIEAMREACEALPLVPGSIVVEPHEAAIGDDAFQAQDGDTALAHPAWFVIASLRGMGVSVEELCAAAAQEPGDTLLFGHCDVEQLQPMDVGGAYVTQGRVGEVGSRTTRDGTRLDHVDVVVEVSSAGGGGTAGRVTSRYLFKRGARP